MKSVSYSECGEHPALTHLVHKGVVHEVRPTNTEVEDVDFLEDGIVEGIQKPGCV